MADAQSPTPSAGNPEGSDMRSVASQIEGLLDDDGQYNPSGKASRALDPESYEESDTRDRDDRGRFTAKQADEVEPDQGDVDPGLEAEGDEQIEDTDGDTSEVQADSAIDEEQDGSEETAPIQTVAELAEALGLSREEFLGSITDTFGAAGEEVTVTLADQLKGFQKDADYRRNTTELADARRQFEYDQTQRMQEFEQHHQMLAQHLNATETIIANRLETPEMVALRQSRPEEWTAIQLEVGQELAQIRQRRQDAAQQYAQFQQSQMLELRGRELDALQRARPDFSNEDKQAVRSTLETLGYMSDEINQIIDHRTILAVLEMGELRNKVAAYEAEMARANKTVQNVKKTIPQLQKPGKQRSGKSSAALQRDNVAKLKSRAAKSGTVQDAAAVIENMIFQ